MKKELYYRYSGRFSPLSLLAGFLAGLAAGFPLAVAYAYLNRYNPIVYFNVFLIAFFGGGAGWAMGWVFRRLRVRNPEAIVWVSLAAMSLSYYVSWGAFACAVYGRGDLFFRFLRQPRYLWEVILAMNQEGVHSFTHLKALALWWWTPKGAILWLFWLAEAAAILFAGAAVAWGVVEEDPYCESCGVWCETSKGACAVNAGDNKKLKQRLEAKDLGCLKELGAVAPDARAWLRLDLDSCPVCQGLNALSVSSVSVKVDEKGKRSEKERSVMRQLLLSSAEAGEIRRLGRQFKAPTDGASI